MSKLFLVNLDMNGNEIQNVVLQPLATAPQSATVGRVYFDTTDGVLKTFDGTNWNPAGAVLSVNNKTGAVTIGKSDVGLGNVDNKSEATIKSDFTGSIADGNTGFVTGDAIYDALANKQAKITASGILKGNGSGGVTAAVAGTDYGTYSKPSGGIPSSDLASAVQTSLTAADNALPKSGGTMSGAIAMGSNKITGLANGTAATDAAAFGQIPVATTTSPKMDGTAAVGSETKWAKGDHVHPTDTSRMAASLKGAANGVAELDANGKVPSSQLPSFVDDVVEGYYYNSKFYKEAAHTTEITGESGKIYVDLSTEKTYRWGSTSYVEISASLALGETSSTAYRGDRGKTAYDHSQVTSGNPHNVSKSDVGLGNVDNKSEATIKSDFTGSIASGNTGFVTGGDVYTAISDSAGALIKTASGTIGTSATTATVSYTGTFINAYATINGSVCVVDIAPGSSSVVFTVAAAPSSAITCVVVYA